MTFLRSVPSDLDDRALKPLRYGALMPLRRPQADRVCSPVVSAILFFARGLVATLLQALIALIAAAAVPSLPMATAQDAGQAFGPAAVVPLVEQQPPAKLIVDPLSAEQLARGRVLIQYRVENLRIVPVFGPNALAVSPRIGHLHVIVDDAPWYWLDASGEPVVVNGLGSGPHKVKIVLADANHRPLDQAVVEFVVPHGDAANSAR